MDDALGPRARLTAMELDVFVQVALGRSNAEIARARQRSISTVSSQVARMLRKFGVTTRRELMALLRRDVPAELARDRDISSKDLATILSERECEVWIRVEGGQSNKYIAAELGLAEGTIGVLLSRARAKLRRRGAATTPGRQGHTIPD